MYMYNNTGPIIFQEVEILKSFDMTQKLYCSLSGHQVTDICRYPNRFGLWETSCFTNLDFFSIRILDRFCFHFW